MNKQIFTKSLFASVLMAISSTTMAQGIINTVAGNGMASFSGDGGPAISATFSNPSGVATDLEGNIYIADYMNHRVRRINIHTGIINTIAGNGTGMYSGMGGPAIEAGMRYPNSVFVDATGNYYVTDHFADCLYEISYATDNCNNDCGNNNQGNSGDGGDGCLATMKIPRGAWKDNAGNKYIADYGNNKIRLLNTAHTVSTFTGGTYGFSPNGTLAPVCAWGSVNGVCVDNRGNVYVSDGANHVVRKIDGTTGRVITIAGNGTAGYSGDGGSPILAQLSNPGHLFVNGAGNLFICDPGNNTIRVMNVFSNATAIKTLAGTGRVGFSGDGGPANAAALNQPAAAWQDGSGTVYIADMGNQRIRSIIGSGYKNVNGLDNTAQSTDISVFPNPSNGTFTVTTSILPVNATIEVYNMLGAKVLDVPMINQQATVNLNQLTGIYTLVINSNNGTATQQIVIGK